MWNEQCKYHSTENKSSRKGAKLEHLCKDKKKKSCDKCTAAKYKRRKVK